MALDMRLRIIIVVFAVVVLFYFFQFILNTMQKKEHFSSHYYDDVEHYEDPKKDDYDLRLELLNEIDNLNITDSKLKASVMELVFSDISQKKFRELKENNNLADFKSEAGKEIKNIYQAALNNDKPVTQEKVPTPTPKVTKTNAISEHLENYLKNANVALPDFKDYYSNDVNNKKEKFNEQLNEVISGLGKLKDLINNKEKEPYIPDLPIPPKSLLNEEENKKPIIEGFENIQSYASFF